MAKHEDDLSDDLEARLDQHLFSQIDRRVLYFPKGIIYPDRAPRHARPGSELLAAGLAAPLKDLASIFLKPAVAYFLVLCLIYPAYLGLFRKPRVIKEVVKETVEVPVIKEVVREKEVAPPASLPGILDVRDFSLGPEAERAATETKSFALAKSDAFFVLSFFVSISADPSAQYDVEIKKADGAWVAGQKDIRSKDGLGNFSLVCTRSVFTTGDYVLRLLKVKRATSAVEEVYPFRFKIVNK